MFNVNNTFSWKALVDEHLVDGERGSGPWPDENIETQRGEWRATVLRAVGRDGGREWRTISVFGEEGDGKREGVRR